jgi:hypothetical protein
MEQTVEAEAKLQAGDWGVAPAVAGEELDEIREEETLEGQDVRVGREVDA